MYLVRSEKRETVSAHSRCDASVDAPFIHRRVPLLSLPLTLLHDLDPGNRDVQRADKPPHHTEGEEVRHVEVVEDHRCVEHAQGQDVAGKQNNTKEVRVEKSMS